MDIFWNTKRTGWLVQTKTKYDDLFPEGLWNTHWWTACPYRSDAIKTYDLEYPLLVGDHIANPPPGTPYKKLRANGRARCIRCVALRKPELVVHSGAIAFADDVLSTLYSYYGRGGVTDYPPPGMEVKAFMRTYREVGGKWLNLK